LDIMLCHSPRAPRPQPTLHMPTTQLLWAAEAVAGHGGIP
jgi:hypothetical protein